MDIASFTIGEGEGEMRPVQDDPAILLDQAFALADLLSEVDAAALGSLSPHLIKSAAGGVATLIATARYFADRQAKR